MGDRLILERLIREGERLNNYINLSVCGEENMVEAEKMIDAEYSTWVSKCTLLLETNYSNNSLTKKFIYASSNNTTENYEAMLKILKAIEGLEGCEIAISAIYKEALG